MSTPRTPNQKRQYAKLNVRLAKYGKLVEQLYDKFNREAAAIALRTDFDPDSEKMFRFQDYPQTRDAIQKLLAEYMSDITATINRTTSEEWQNSNNFQDLVVNKVLKAYGVKAKDGTEYERYFQANSDHLKAFQTRTVNGMNLSRRVWNLKEQYKQELEMGMSVGIERGTSAASLAKQMKQYLKEPDKLFRRVRDKYGNLQLSKNAKAYHPGRGVYRSSYKNAMRLTRSETNMAYRTAEQTRWRQFDFVVGYEIKLSQSHPCHDVCDELAGKYPKDFVWTGWHPMDMCYCVSILKSEDEFWRDLGNEENAPKSEKEVTDVPDAFKEWVKYNADRIETAEKRGTQPYFIRDNKEYIQDILKLRDSEYEANNGNSKQEVKKTPQEIAAERHSARTQDDIDRIQSAWNNSRMNYLNDLAQRLNPEEIKDYFDMARILKDDNSLDDFSAFKSDYKLAKKILDDKIAEQTLLTRRFMEDPGNVANMQALSRILGIPQGDYMTFYEANLLKGNPNYIQDAIYRINCQTCVVAYELRRRGFDLEALGNTAGSWLEKLSRQTNAIWRDADGNIPKKVRIGAKFNKKYEKNGVEYGIWEKTIANRKQLIKSLESSITEDGRFHIDWAWNSQSKRSLKGHIITLEKMGNVIRYYDPQNGKLITNFYDYIADIKLNHGINVLRVDNLRIDTEFASHILGKSGSKAVSGIVGIGEVTGKESIAELIKMRNEAKTNAERLKLTQEIIKDNGFKKIKSLSTKDNSIYTLNPEDLKTPANQKELPKNLSMAKKMVKNGYDAYLLSNPHGIKSADYVFVKNGKIYYMEGKQITGKSSLQYNLSSAASQSERILIDIINIRDSKYISSELITVFDNNPELQEVKLLKGSREISITRRKLESKNFYLDFKKEWERKK